MVFEEDSRSSERIRQFIDRIIFSLALIPVLEKDIEQAQEIQFFKTLILVLISIYISFRLEGILNKWSQLSEPIFRVIWYSFLLKIVSLVQYFLTFTAIKIISIRLNSYLEDTSVLSLQIVRPFLLAVSVIFIITLLQHFTFFTTHRVPLSEKEQEEIRKQHLYLFHQ